MSDWDRYAAEEYELLVAEEGNAEGMEDDDGGGMGDHYEDDEAAVAAAQDMHLDGDVAAPAADRAILDGGQNGQHEPMVT